VAKNLITKNILNKKSLPESSVIYIFEDDLITPGAKDFIIQKKYKCRYIEKEDLKKLIKEILEEEIKSQELSEQKIYKIINEVIKKII
jgi:ethanolamine utilization cobalamin adenosyltransferase